MADLIDRAALGIGKANPNVFEKPEYADGWNSAIDILQKASTVDVVEVVRCKDCKHFMEYTKQYKRCVEGADGDCRIRLFHSCEKQFIACKYSDFCSYGERKERSD